MGRTPETQAAYGQLIGTLVRKEGLRHFDRSGVGQVIEHSSRMVVDGGKLSIHMQRVTDLLREANYWASQNGNGAVTADDVQRAIDAWVYRSDQTRERMQEEVQLAVLKVIAPHRPNFMLSSRRLQMCR